MFIFRLLKKNRSCRNGSAIHLVVFAFLVSLSIYIWNLSGCLGLSDCYLCMAFSPESFINSTAKDSSINDFARLIDLKNFSFLINNLICNNTELNLLVLVSSDPNNFKKRLTIRSTWGRKISNQLKVMFLLGIPKDEHTQKKLDEENKINSDLIQGSFIDTYRNLSYKHVMALKWTKHFCPRTKYLLKADDDVFIHSPRFLKYVNQELEPLPETNLIQCLPVYDGFARRTWRSKWRVSWSEYKFRKYPPYCQGFAILYSSDAVFNLYEKAQMANYFWIDDVLITGILAAFANYSLSAFGSLLMEPIDFYRFSVNNSFLLGPWNIKMNVMKKLWEAFKDDFDQS